jgi:hypothetical protein
MLIHASQRDDHNAAPLMAFPLLSCHSSTESRARSQITTNPSNVIANSLSQITTNSLPHMTTNPKNDAGQ